MKFSYSGAARVGRAIESAAGMAAFLLSTFVAVGMPVGATVSGDPRTGLNLMCFSVWALLVGWSIASLLLNGYPDIWIEDDYVTISAFVFARIRIPWKDVVDIRNMGWPLARTVVRTRQITPLHRVIGWVYGRTALPSFAVRPQIDGYQELMRILSQRIERSSRKT